MRSFSFYSTYVFYLWRFIAIWYTQTYNKGSFFIFVQNISHVANKRK